MLAELSACTLDIIGKAGMGYDLEAMTDKPNELRDTYTKTISVAFKLDLMALLKMTIKAARMIPTERTRVLQASRATARRVASTLIAEKRATRLGKDVLSLMIDRLPDTELQDQVTTLLFAGHETTSTSLAFCLRLLALHPEIQTRLRDEVMHSDAHPDMKTLNSLTYLDRVVHESLRLESPVTHVTRQAAIDTLLPLETPVNGITALPVRAGDKINIRECIQYSADSSLLLHQRQGIPLGPQLYGV
jgi:cytochrome P450